MSFLDVFPFLNDFTFILFLVSCGFFVRIGMILMSEIAAGNKKRSIKCGASPANPSRIISPKHSCHYRCLVKCGLIEKKHCLMKLVAFLLERMM